MPRAFVAVHTVHGDGRARAWFAELERLFGNASTDRVLGLTARRG
ncbi:hypothetical protein ACH0CA_00735 [Kytococcus sedentarius]